MKLHLAALATVAVAFTVPPAWAEHDCDAPTVIDVGGVAYVVIYHVADGDAYLVSAWIILECNGQPGPQDGGVSLLGDPNPCQSSANPDCTLF